MSIGRNAYSLTFEISPIIFTNGIATFIPGQMLPIISITQAGAFAAGILGAATGKGLGGLVSSFLDLDDYFARFYPLPGSTLVENRVATFPFANQAIAANALIAQPLTISMMMIVPARGNSGGVAFKLAVMMALQQAFTQHCSLGGTFIVATPSYFYTNCVFLKMTDVSAGETKQPQYRYQLDFYQPLLTEQQATQSMNSSMSKINGQLPYDGSLSGNTSVPVPPSLVGISQIPAGSNLGGSAAAPPGPVGSSPLPSNLG